MTVQAPQTGALRQGRAPYFTRLPPLSKRSADPWYLRLGGDVATLLRADNTPVLEVHRDEAARYMRFRYDVFRGRIVTFAVVPGAKEYTFRLPSLARSRLLDWIPRRSEAELRREVRFAGGAVALLGALHLVLPAYLSAVAGVALLAIAAFAVAAPARSRYAVNAVALLLAGLWALLPGHSEGIDPRSLPPEEFLIPVAIGSILLLSAVGQFSMLGSNHLLRAARELRDRRESIVPDRSDLVRRLSAALFIAAVLCALGAGALSVLSAASMLDGTFADRVACAVLAGLLLVSGAVLRVKRRAVPYAEAKVSGQLLASLIPLIFWAVVIGFMARSPGEGYTGVLSGDLSFLARPYVWGSVVASVLLFNRGFNRVMERELEEHRI